MPQVTVSESWLTIIVGVATALGTLTLAFFTWRLARSTRADVEAQWRPLLVPAIRITAGAAGAPVKSGWAELGDLGDFHFCFENVGKGPAVGVQGATTNPPGIFPFPYSSCDELPNPVVNVGGRVEFRKVDPNIDNNRIRLSITYDDLAGNGYQTEAHYVRVSTNQDWRIDLVKPNRIEYLNGAKALRIELKWRAVWPWRTARRVLTHIVRHFSREP